ncbi:MAG: hypothetical protein KKG75_01780 [Nanoarchaeota archaeon]|nr:hypothetical protein [Nanoarchaeota archaeon]
MPIKKNIVKWEFHSRYLLPLILTFIGFYFLFKQYGIIPENITVWPWLLIIIGVTWLLKEINQ